MTREGILQFFDWYILLLVHALAGLLVVLALATVILKVLDLIFYKIALAYGLTKDFIAFMWQQHQKRNKR